MSIKRTLSLDLFFSSFLFLLFSLFVLLLLNEKALADSCQDIKTICLQAGGTRYFDGVEVTLPCWQYQITRSCGETTDDNCKELRSQGCVQIDSKCRTMLGDICVVQDETYNCPVEKCEDTDGIVCGDEFFCMNGDCSEHNPVLNKNFGQDVTKMAAVTAAAEDVKKQQKDRDHPDVFIFTGKPMECSIDFAHSKDCCKDTGWLKGLILNCDSEEEELGKAKETGLVVEAGDGTNNTYCHTKFIECLAKHRVYCVFPNKLAQVIQAKGRKEQLGINFGYVSDDDAHPDCRGLTPDEISKIDFSKIDFSFLEDDIKKNLNFPAQDPTTRTILERVKQFYDKHKKHD